MELVDENFNPIYQLYDPKLLNKKKDLDLIVLKTYKNQDEVNLDEVREGAITLLQPTTLKELIELKNTSEINNEMLKAKNYYNIFSNNFWKKGLFAKVFGLGFGAGAGTLFIGWPGFILGAIVPTEIGRISIRKINKISIKKQIEEIDNYQNLIKTINDAEIKIITSEEYKILSNEIREHYEASTKSGNLLEFKHDVANNQLRQACTRI